MHAQHNIAPLAMQQRTAKRAKNQELSSERGVYIVSVLVEAAT